jgi:hypothetical protein
MECVKVDLLFPSTYHAVLAVKVCAHGVRLRPGGRLRTLTTALQRAGAGLGQFRPLQTGADHVAAFSFP